jgi:hypothetical protein
MADQAQKTEKRMECFTNTYAECKNNFIRIESMIENQNKDTKEIIGILRGEGQDPGLVGRVHECERDLDGVKKVFRRVWGMVSAIIIGVVTLFFKKSS